MSQCDEAVTRIAYSATGTTAVGTKRTSSDGGAVKMHWNGDYSAAASSPRYACPIAAVSRS